MINRLIKVKSISCNLSAVQWGLYSHMSNADNVAGELNKTIEDLYAKDMSSLALREALLELMYSHRSCGAYDTEPMMVLGEIIAELYGEED